LARGGYSGSYADYLRRSEDAGYPAGTRYEFASVVFAQQMLAPDQPARDLVLHLIGTHHGYGRPLPRFIPDNAAFSCTEPGGYRITAAEVQHLCEFGSGWVDRFWQLNYQYGYWGLAYLEAILRTADWAASREERNNQQMKEKEADA
jgi:CRISPR-associated endonuclease/helicase Cas3